MVTLVLGLGNIGERYKLSRHNLGLWVVEHLVDANKLKLWSEPGEYCWVARELQSAKIIFAMPTTYMNRSGIAARALLQRYELDASQMLVVVDDFNLPLGRIRIRGSGSDGGHNGLASVIDELGTTDFPRLRIGIGPLPEGVEQTDFVLGDFEPDEIESVKKMIATASEAVTFYLRSGLDEAMSLYNQNPA